MPNEKTNTMSEVLGLLDNLRNEAGNLTSEMTMPLFDDEQTGAIADYLEKMVLQFTERISAMQDIIERTNRIREQMSDEIDVMASKRHAFFNALKQLDRSHAEGVLERIKDLEEEQSRKEHGEFADMAVWEAAKVVLQRTGRQMTTREIVSAIEAGGKTLGPNATSKVSAALQTGNAANVFKAIKISGSRQRWTLREQEDTALEKEEGDNEN